MYLLEGVSEMHQRYDLKVGDVMIFAHLPDNNLIVAGRPMTEVSSDCSVVILHWPFLSNYELCLVWKSEM